MDEPHKAYLDEQLRELKTYLDERVSAHRAANSRELNAIYKEKLRDLEKTVKDYRSRAVYAYENEMAYIEGQRTKADEHEARLLALREKSAKRSLERSFGYAKDAVDGFVDSYRGLL
ncbi:MAG TPA: hypothetical protein VI968_03360 [archaeon]|nr:hypothetical protein [archaeon]